MSQAGEQAYVDEVHRLSRIGERFYQECTPGYYNAEGAPESGAGFLLQDVRRRDALRFFDLLDAWRDEGSLRGLELR